MPEQDSSPIPVTIEEAAAFNSVRYGIFHTVNEFHSEVRRIDNLKAIRAWYVEMDGDKRAQEVKIKDSPIYPSRIIESKNGYHVYFNAVDATKENYTIIQKGLIKHFNGDPRAKDLARILRAPSYYHWKDPNDPFLIRETFWLDVSYREKDMFYFFPYNEEIEAKNPKRREEKIIVSGADLTTVLNGLDNEMALMMLSGTPHVNHEVYNLKRVARDRKNIYVNGRSTSCFIDENKKIGANPGGPNIFTWLRYYGHTDKKIYQILKEVGIC